MRLKSDSTEQKIRGAYYTPQKLADFMVRLFEKDSSIKTILEPSCGDGVFVESILNNKNLQSLKSITAVEIVEEEAKKVIKKTGNNNKLNVIINDFILMYDKLLQKEKFDLVVGNPPYIRYQYLTEEQRELQSQILISNRMKSNKLINAWVCFLVACVQLLNKNGKIAFVIPAELLQVAYAEDLRLYLSNSFSKITLITFRELVFPSIEQEVILFIGEKDEKSECENALIGVKELQSLEELDSFSFHDIKYQKVKHTKEKWTKYFTSDNEVKLIESIKLDERFVQFRDISIVNVGITTGDNNYFSVNDDVVKEFKFKNIALPLIGRSAHARGVYFTKEDWKYNIGKGKNAYLLCFPDTPYDKYPEEHKRYIEMGEKKGVHKGYKCSIRDKWYRVPSVWVPDAFFLRRNDSFPKFVLNEIDAVSTDTMHRIKFKDGVDRHKALLSYYNSITFAFTEINGRSYGGGVLEVLPGEVSAILLPKVDMLDEKETCKLIGIIDENIRNQGNIEEVLDIIDREVLVKHLKIDKNTCVQFRDIWKKLMARRKGRSR